MKDKIYRAYKEGCPQEGHVPLYCKRGTYNVKNIERSDVDNNKKETKREDDKRNKHQLYYWFYEHVY